MHHMNSHPHHYYVFFFFNDTATTEIYTLSLHDALPIFRLRLRLRNHRGAATAAGGQLQENVTVSRTFIAFLADRKSTRLNSSHSQISYAVFCLKKKKKQKINVQGNIIKQGTQNTPNSSY